MEIALFCDIRIAAEDAVFGLPEMGLGIIPGAGGTQTLPRVIGLSRSLDMLLTNRRIYAQEALDAGLVSRVVPGDRLLEMAKEIALKIASCSVTAVRNAKQAILQGLDMSLQQGLELERRLAKNIRISGDPTTTNQG
jgi:enoyl-CoA hydratase